MQLKSKKGNGNWCIRVELIGWGATVLKLLVEEFILSCLGVKIVFRVWDSF